MKNKKLILPLALAAVILVFFVQNADVMPVNFLFWSVTMRRVYVLFCVLAIGTAIGWLLRGHYYDRRK